MPTQRKIGREAAVQPPRLLSQRHDGFDGCSQCKGSEHWYQANDEVREVHANLRASVDACDIDVVRAEHASCP